MARLDDYYGYYVPTPSKKKKKEKSGRSATLADILRHSVGDVDLGPFSYGSNIPEKYRFINPQTIGDLSERDKRRLYSELRSIARKRADRLEAAGFEARRFDPVANVDRDDIDDALAEVAYYLRTPGSSVKAAKKEKEQASLAAHGYNVENVNEYGKFMDAVRYRFKNRKLRDSDPFYQVYVESVEKRKMSVKTLHREFGQYLNEIEDAKKLRDALQAAPERTAGRDRLTAKNLKDILDLL